LLHFAEDEDGDEEVERGRDRAGNEQFHGRVLGRILDCLRIDTKVGIIPACLVVLPQV